jgi:DNA-directed RNA polymerase subunit H (RpoH/RPB5)
MESDNGHISKLFKARSNLIEILSERGYDVSEYDAFGVGQLACMIKNDQLDLLLKHKDGRKIFVKHILDKSKSLKPIILDNIVDDIFLVGEILTKADDLMIIMNVDPNDTAVEKINTIWDKHGIYISVVGIKRLYFNILKHKSVPKMVIMTDEEKDELFQKFNIKDGSQLPEINRSDPTAIAIGLRPGKVCKITCKNKSAITSSYFRICI